jgi:hypothetical protein
MPDEPLPHHKWRTVKNKAEAMEPQPLSEEDTGTADDNLSAEFVSAAREMADRISRGEDSTLQLAVLGMQQAEVTVPRLIADLETARRERDEAIAQLKAIDDQLWVVNDEYRDTIVKFAYELTVLLDEARSERDRERQISRDLARALKKIRQTRRGSICSLLTHKPLRSPLCWHCQIDARIEESEPALAAYNEAHPKDRV